MLSKNVKTNPQMKKPLFNKKIIFKTETVYKKSKYHQKDLEKAEAKKLQTMKQANETGKKKNCLKSSKRLRFKQTSIYRTGRWQPEEHKRFIEAILKYGNEWKKVQNHVGTRSSTQARSHAQKFFVKMKRVNYMEINLDLNKNVIKSLHEMALTMDSEQYFKTIKDLNILAYEKKIKGNNPLEYNNGNDIYENISDEKFEQNLMENDDFDFKIKFLKEKFHLDNEEASNLANFFHQTLEFIDSSTFELSNMNSNCFNSKASEFKHRILETPERNLLNKKNSRVENHDLNDSLANALPDIFSLSIEESLISENSEEAESIIWNWFEQDQNKSKNDSSQEEIWDIASLQHILEINEYATNSNSKNSIGFQTSLQPEITIRDISEFLSN